METASKNNNLSRMALGALDVNSHLQSPGMGSTQHKPSSPVRKNLGYQETQTRNMGMYSLKDSSTPLPAQQTPRSPRRAMFGAVEQTPSRSGEKRKAQHVLVSGVGTQDEAGRAVKQARLSQPPMGHSRQSSGAARGHSRQSSANGHAHKLFGEIPKDDEEMESSQGTIANSSFNDEENDASQLTAVSVPDAQGPTPPARHTPPHTPETLRLNAQALKLRLQFAMYKLQTHQEHVPLSHVKVVAKNPRFPRVVSSPRLPPTRDASRATSPRSPAPIYSTGHSRQQSGSERTEGQQEESGRIAGHEPVGDETDQDEADGRERDTVSPEQRDVARATVGGYPGLRGRSTVMGTPERQDRLLSLVDAIESAEKQSGGHL